MYKLALIILIVSTVIAVLRCIGFLLYSDTDRQLDALRGIRRSYDCRFQLLLILISGLWLIL